jgi:hypothetical protein
MLSVKRGQGLVEKRFSEMLTVTAETVELLVARALGLRQSRRPCVGGWQKQASTSFWVREEYVGCWHNCLVVYLTGGRDCSSLEVQPIDSRQPLCPERSHYVRPVAPSASNKPAVVTVAVASCWPVSVLPEFGFPSHRG